MKKVLNVLLIALILTILWILFLVMKPNSYKVQSIKSIKTEYDNYYVEIDKKIEKEFNKNPKKLYEERKNNLKRLNSDLGFARVRKYLEDNEYIFCFARNGKLIFILKKDSPDSNSGVIKYLYDNQSLKEIGYVEGRNLDFSGKVQVFDEKGILRREAQYYKGKLEGLEIECYESGKVKIRINYKNGKLQGEALSFYENGKLKEENTYKDGIDSGPYKIYYENGILKEEGTTQNNQLNGKITFYDKEGKLKETGTYING